MVLAVSPAPAAKLKKKGMGILEVYARKIHHGNFNISFSQLLNITEKLTVLKSNFVGDHHFFFLEVCWVQEMSRSTANGHSLTHLILLPQQKLSQDF